MTASAQSTAYPGGYPAAYAAVDALNLGLDRFEYAQVEVPAELVVDALNRAGGRGWRHIKSDRLTTVTGAETGGVRLLLERRIP